MSNFAGGLVSFLVLLLLLALRVPIGVAMLAVGVGGFIWIQGLGPLLSFLKTTPFETFSNYSFSVIPLFLLMGNVASSTGLSARLFRGANALLGNLRGGVAMAAVAAAAATKLRFGMRRRHIGETWPVVGIFLVVFVGMNGDFFVGRSLFTPTEGAAIGALLATIAACTIGGLRWRNVFGSLLATA